MIEGACASKCHELQIQEGDHALVNLNIFNAVHTQLLLLSDINQQSSFMCSLITSGIILPNRDLESFGLRGSFPERRRRDSSTGEGFSLRRGVRVDRFGTATERVCMWLYLNLR